MVGRFLLGLLLGMGWGLPVGVAQDSRAGDCVDAVPICLPRYSLDRRPWDRYDQPSEIDPFFSCLKSGERNGVWYRFSPDRDGLVSFLITPGQPVADYDWAVYDLTDATCADILDRPDLEISCNFSGQTGPTGANGSTTLTSQDADGGRFNARIPVRGGGRYVLYVSSFEEDEASFGGYTIDFNLQTDEPRFTDTEPPALQRVAAPDRCLADTLRLFFDEYIDCLSLDASDFELTTPDGQVVPVAELLAPECGEIPVGLTRWVRLRWAAPYTAVGFYTLSLVGPIADACGNVSDAGSLRFSLNDLELQVTAPPDYLYCGTAGGVQLAALVVGTPSPEVRWLWSPPDGLDDPERPDPLAFPERTTTYEVFALAGSCRSVPARVRVTVVPRPRVLFDGPSVGCAGDELTFVAAGAEGFRWPDANLDGPRYVARFPAGDTVLRLVPFVQGCAGDTLRYPLRIIGRPTPRLDLSAPTACVGQTIRLTDPNAQPGWTYRLETDGGTRAGGQFPDGLDLYWLTPGFKSIFLETEAEGCVGPALRQAVRIDPVPVVVPPVDAVWCRDEAPPQLRPQVPAGCACRWEPAEGLDNPTTCQPIARPGATTTYTLTVLCGDCASDPLTVRVDVEEVPPVAFERVREEFCAGQAGVRLRPVFSEDEPYGYLWEPTVGLDRPYDPDPVATPDRPTTYTLRRIGRNGCVGAAGAVLVQVNPRPRADAGPDGQFCQGEAGVQLEGWGDGGTGAYSFRWSPETGLSDPAVADPLARPSESTLYRLTVKDPVTGCLSEPVDDASFAWVRVVDRPVARAGPDVTLCEGQMAILGDAPSGGGSGYRSEWTPTRGLDDAASPTPRAAPLQTQTYALRVESGGCWSDPDSVQVTVLPTPRLDWTANEWWLCPGDSVELRLATLETGVRYRWKPAAGLSDSTGMPVWASPARTTTYTVTALRAGCFEGAEAELRVNVRELPPLDADAELDPNQRYYCPGESLVVAAAFGPTDRPTRFRWSPAAGLNRTDLLNPLADPPVTTTYTLEVEWEGCHLRDSLEIVVGPRVVAQLEAAPDTLCAGQPVRLRASGGAGDPAYRWLPEDLRTAGAGAEVQAFPLRSGPVGVELREGHCADTAWVDVVVFPQPVADFDVAPDPNCRPGAVSLRNRSRDFRYSLWDLGDGSPPVNQRDPVHTYATAGGYTVRLVVRDTGGCADTLERRLPVRFIEPLAAALRYRPTDTLYLHEAWLWAWSAAEGAVDWLWDFGDGQAGRGQSVSHRYAEAGEFALMLAVIDSAGCVARDTARVVVSDRRGWLPNVFTPNGDSRNDDWGYPEGDYVRFELVVFDRWGRQVFRATQSADRWRGEDQLSGQPAAEGVYYWRVRADGYERAGQVTLLR